MQQGKVIAPKDAKPVAEKLMPGVVSVKVISVDHENPKHAPEESEHWEILMEYPDKFRKSHQVAKDSAIETIVSIVQNQLKGRHGSEAGKFATILPKTFEELAGKFLIFREAV